MNFGAQKDGLARCRTGSLPSERVRMRGMVRAEGSTNAPLLSSHHSRRKALDLRSRLFELVSFPHQRMSL